MLVLTRKSGETIVIGDDIQITIVQVKGKQVRIGIKAPKSVKVHRLEIFEQDKKNQKKLDLTGSD